MRDNRIGTWRERTEGEEENDEEEEENERERNRKQMEEIRGIEEKPAKLLLQVKSISSTNSVFTPWTWVLVIHDSPSSEKISNREHQKRRKGRHGAL